MTSNLSTVAICIPTYNQSAFLAESVRSACAQTYPVEVWVGDDCSTDDTMQVLERLQRELSNLHIHRQERNLGITLNNNALLRLPQTEFIARLDSDDLMAPEYIEKLLVLLNKFPGAAYAHCAVQEIGERDELRRVRRLGARGEFQSADDALRAQASGYRVAANICLFRTRSLRNVDFYRPQVRYSQDWDMAVRLADAGWGNVYLNEILASYRVWEDAGKIRPKRQIIEVADYIRIFEDSILPAFDRRNWENAPVWKARRNIALGHATTLDSRLFSAREKQELLRLVHQLGGSSALRVQNFLLRCGLGNIVRARNRFIVLCKDIVKNVIACLKCLSR